MFLTFTFFTLGTTLQLCLPMKNKRGSLLCIWELLLRKIFAIRIRCYQACQKVHMGIEWMISRASPVSLHCCVYEVSIVMRSVYCVLHLELSLYCFGGPDPHFNLQICVPSDTVATQAHDAIEHLKCGKTRLRRTLSIKYPLDFEDLE